MILGNPIKPNQVVHQISYVYVCLHRFCADVFPWLPKHQDIPGNQEGQNDSGEIITEGNKFHR